ncbi:AbfB domain-containing protein [Polyangium jinanense]|uniref:AbfB domain-containing protein n=1 Tax=Polyangium jinanense TaxID=2829994 RepID=A0A9X4B0X3_9BACT|nr:AbfB domain-containing protein [Polyangium jinanense]MDC3962738.1 AbfB domain-containing protein [Polyangium jinanense]MDC3989587.1 AbfB domain-containing protein [Polyangium jinanense]
MVQLCDFVVAGFAVQCALIAGCGASASQVEEDVGESEATIETGDFVSIESYNLRGYYLRHRNYLGELTTISSGLDRADATFRLVPGLANTACYSFESSNFPGYYLRHQDFRIKLHPYAGDSLYRNDATFCMRPSIQPGVGTPWVSFESYNLPGYYLRHANYHFFIGNQGGPFREDATFQLVDPL